MAEHEPSEKQDYMFIITIEKPYDGFRIERSLTDDEGLEFYKRLQKTWPEAKIEAIAFPPRRGHMMSDIWRKVGMI